MTSFSFSNDTFLREIQYPLLYSWCIAQTLAFSTTLLVERHYCSPEAIRVTTKVAEEIRQYTYWDILDFINEERGEMQPVRSIKVLRLRDMGIINSAKHLRELPEFPFDECLREINNVFTQEILSRYASQQLSELWEGLAHELIELIRKYAKISYLRDTMFLFNTYVKTGKSQHLLASCDNVYKSS